MLILYERKENMIGANAEAVPGVEDILSPKKAPTCLPVAVLTPWTDVDCWHILGLLASNERHMKRVRGCAARCCSMSGFGLLFTSFARIPGRKYCQIVVCT